MPCLCCHSVFAIIFKARGFLTASAVAGSNLTGIPFSIKLFVYCQCHYVAMSQKVSNSFRLQNITFVITNYEDPGVLTHAAAFLSSCLPLSYVAIEASLVCSRCCRSK